MQPYIIIAAIASFISINQDTEIERLVRQLGSNRFIERESASKALLLIGEGSLSALTTATQNKDPEIRYRSHSIIAKINGRIYREIYCFHGHKAAVSAVAFTPNGQWALSASFDKTIRIWDIATGTELNIMKGHEDYVYGIAITPESKRAYSWSADRTIRFWDLQNSKQIRIVSKIDNYSHQIAFIANFNIAIPCSRTNDGSLRFIDTKNGHIVRKMKGHTHSLNDAVASCDSKRLLTAGFDSKIRMWDIVGNKQIWELQEKDGHTAASIAFTPNGQKVIAGWCGGSLRVYDAVTSKEVRCLQKLGSEVNALACSPNSRFLISGHIDGRIRLWDIIAGKELHVFRGHSSAVMTLAFSPNGRLFLSGGRDDTVRLWHLPSYISTR